MPVDQTSLDRIRNATFPSARRGYDKNEVEKFLARLADWLETGGGDESRSDVVKKELEKVGQRTGAILAQAEESAQQIRAEAEDEARGTVNAANMQALETRTEVDSYATETRTSADVYAEETRKAAEDVLASAQAEADAKTREAIQAAEARVRRIVEEGMQRREDIEAVIADLVRRREDVLTDTEELSGKLNRAVSEHRPEPGTDEFRKPDEYDPLAREGGDELGDRSETAVADTEVADTEVADTKVADTEVADTEVADTEVAAPEIADPESGHEADLRR